MNIYFTKVAKVLAFCSLVCAASASNATTVTDTVNPATNILVNSANPYTFTHVLTDNGVPSTHQVNSASIEIDLTDSLFDFAGEKAKFTFDTMTTGLYDVSWFGSEYSFTLAALLLGDGLLSVTVSAQNGDFYFLQSVLTADVTLKPVVVPEPASLLLFSLGMFGLVASRKHLSKHI